MKLLSLLRAAKLETSASGDVQIRAITADSRVVEPGTLFVAVRGTARDGHDYIDDALARGAVAVVAERAMGTAQVPLVRVDNTRHALAALASAWHGHPATRIPLVGITGTVGKTSVLGLLAAILEHAGIRADGRNRVSDEEHAAFTAALDAHGVRYEERDQLRDAVHTVLEHAGDGDLVLLLGAQGMDRGQDVAREWLAERR